LNHIKSTADQIESNRVFRKLHTSTHESPVLSQGHSSKIASALSRSHTLRAIRSKLWDM